VIFLSRENNSKSRKKPFVDLTPYISPQNVKADPFGSYTGVPADMFYNNELDEQPVQDADDL
jgi:hypothetical protein